MKGKGTEHNTSIYLSKFVHSFCKVLLRTDYVLGFSMGTFQWMCLLCVSEEVGIVTFGETLSWKRASGLGPCDMEVGWGREEGYRAIQRLWQSPVALWACVHNCLFEMSLVSFKGELTQISVRARLLKNLLLWGLECVLKYKYLWWNKTFSYNLYLLAKFFNFCVKWRPCVIVQKKWPVHIP